MKIEDLEIPGVKLAHLIRHDDGRGWFMELMREEAFSVSFVQGNHSHSRKNVLRGLHYHANQSDAWYVVSGAAQVGLVDLRQAVERPRTLTVDLSEDEPKVLYIPPGVAHGFYAVTELDLIYWVTHYFDNSDEHSIAWNDPAIQIDWSATDPIVSPRDAAAPAYQPDAVRRVLADSN